MSADKTRVNASMHVGDDARWMGYVRVSVSQKPHAYVALTLGAQPLEEITLFIQSVDQLVAFAAVATEFAVKLQEAQRRMEFAQATNSTEAVAKAAAAIDPTSSDEVPF